MRQIKAATIRQKGGPFQIENLMLDEPRPGEVLVRVVATGMCHTDMVACDQLYEVPMPIVLGHEGAGVVEQVGGNGSRSGCARDYRWWGRTLHA